MKKNLIISLLAIASVSALCGFDSAETAQSVYEKANQASMEQAGGYADVILNADANIKISDGSTESSIGIGLNGEFESNIAMDPMGMEMKGSMDMSFMGTSQTMEEEMYMVTNEDGTAKTYVYTKDSTSEEGTWAVQSMEGLDMASLMEMSAAISLDDLAAWGISFDLVPEAVDVAGTECYVLASTITSDSFATMLAKASEMSGQEVPAEVSEVLPYLQGLQIYIEYYVDTETFLPVGAHIDMNDSDLTTINAIVGAMMAGEGGSAEIILNDLSIDCATAYGDAPEITVPAEALEAEASGAAESLSDMATEVVG